MEMKYITPDDKAEYDKFFSHHVMQVAHCKPGSKVCHYTTGDALIKILESGKLWSTQASCLNDSKELLYAVEALLGVIEKRRKAGVDPKFEPCLREIEKRVAATTTETAGMFVTCFSSEIDDLSQWRGYGGEAGYAIVFDLAALRFAAALNGDMVMPVLYGEEAGQLLNDVITWAQNFYLAGLSANRAPSVEEWTDEFTRFWLWNLQHFAPMIKDGSFHKESEWRLIHFLLDTEVAKLCFLQRRSMMSIHLPIALRMSRDDTSSLLPFESVVVGPTYNKRVSQVAVGDLLRARGYSDKIASLTTNIPYRPYL